MTEILALLLGVFSLFLSLGCAYLYSRAQTQERQLQELQNDRTQKAAEHDLQIRSLVQARQELKQDREDLKQDRALLREQELQKQRDLFERKKQNWSEHETKATEYLRSLCRRLDLEYFDKNTFPLAKRPDFAVQLGAHFVIFDAKAPSDPENISYFSEYLKKQAENMEKYLKQDGVRKEGFLVVPSDTLQNLQGRFFHEIGGHQIHVICIESLDSALRLLKKIEDFEVIEGLGPEEQESIATFIGQGNRLMKRKVQIDQFFTKKIIDLLRSGESLPQEIIEKINVKEKSFAINPPRVDRGKNLALTDIEKGQTSLQKHLR